jgi:DNA-directed RNA polymerase specialized sigma24 family protein
METLQGFLLKTVRKMFLACRRKMGLCAEPLDMQVDPLPGPERVVEAQLTLDIVQTFLQQLPECDRTAFLLRVLCKIPVEKIARILEISEMNGRVKVQLRPKKRMLLLGPDIQISNVLQE